MDDGDILGARNHVSLPGQQRNEFELKTDFSVTSPTMVQDCGIDLNSLTSEYVRRRYFLATRTVVPHEVVRTKLENNTGLPTNDETVMVLATLAKGYIANKIETVRMRQRRVTPERSRNAISVPDLLGFKDLQRPSKTT